MKWQLFIIFFWISMISAMQYSQTTWGNGELSSQANTGGASEGIQATGEQKHILYIENRKENSRLDSVYRLNVSSTNLSNEDGFAIDTNKKLKKHSYYLPNTYKISLGIDGAIGHYAEIHSMGDISSTSAIEYGLVGSSTDFNLSFQRGTSEEKVISLLDKKSHGLPIVQTFMNGSMGIGSHLEDDTILEADLSDADRLRENLDSVNLYGETARLELYPSKTEISVQGRSININDYRSLPADVTKRLNKSLLKKETIPKVVRDSMDQLGITDVTGISDSSDQVTDHENGEANNEKLTTKSNNASQNEVISENICSFNSTATGKDERTNCSNETNGDAGGWNDSTEPVDAQEEPGTGIFQDGYNETVLEGEDTIFVWEDMPDLFPPVVTERATYRLGGTQLRLGTAHVGRKVRTDGYFSEEKVPISNLTLSQANVTRSIALTNWGRI